MKAPSYETLCNKFAELCGPRMQCRHSFDESTGMWRIRLYVKTRYDDGWGYLHYSPEDPCLETAYKMMFENLIVKNFNSGWQSRSEWEKKFDIVMPEFWSEEELRFKLEMMLP